MVHIKYHITIVKLKIDAFIIRLFSCFYPFFYPIYILSGKVYNIFVFIVGGVILLKKLFWYYFY